MKNWSWLLLIAVIATVLAVGVGMFVRADAADPEIGQPVSAQRYRITTLDTTGDDSVLSDCATGDKHFVLTAHIKRRTPGRFVQVGHSIARLKLTTGEVLRARGITDDAKRRLMFTLSPDLPSGVATIDQAARRFMIAATNDPRSTVAIGPVKKFCLQSGSV